MYITEPERLQGSSLIHRLQSQIQSCSLRGNSEEKHRKISHVAWYHHDINGSFGGSVLWMASPQLMN